MPSDDPISALEVLDASDGRQRSPISRFSKHAAMRASGPDRSPQTRFQQPLWASLACKDFKGRLQ
jgi:hypothetical protein